MVKGLEVFCGSTRVLHTCARIPTLHSSPTQPLALVSKTGTKGNEVETEPLNKFVDDSPDASFLVWDATTELCDLTVYWLLRCNILL